MAPISIPTPTQLPSSLRVDPTNPAVQRALNRLSRPSLLSLALDWLGTENQSLTRPFLLADADAQDDEIDDLYPPAQSIEELKGLYTELQTRKGSRREIVDRIATGDWRHGLTLYQLGMADLAHLSDHPAALKWAAYRIVPLAASHSADDADAIAMHDKKSMTVPRFHPSAFVHNLQAQVLPDVKAHYMFDRPRGLPLLLLRILLLDSPYVTAAALATPADGALSLDAARTVYIAVPDASPHIYLSLSGNAGGGVGESKSLRALMVEGIPKALSRPRARVGLKVTSLQTKNLEALLALRGAGRTNAASGGWSVYAKEKADSPLDSRLPKPPATKKDEGAGKAQGLAFRFRDSQEVEVQARKRRRLVAEGRFGESARVDDGKGIERLDIRLDEPFSKQRDLPEDVDVGEPEVAEQEQANKQRRGRHSDVAAELRREQDDDSSERNPSSSWRPEIRMTFYGGHVFAGIRQLAEAGIVDGKRMPGWMTGEEGVSVGVITDGRIRGFKGSGV